MMKNAGYLQILENSLEQEETQLKNVQHLEHTGNRKWDYWCKQNPAGN